VTEHGPNTAFQDVAKDIDRRHPNTKTEPKLMRAVGCGEERTASYNAAIQGWLNTAVKGMHRPDAVLEVGF
jgi:hypothetical protein